MTVNFLKATKTAFSQLAYHSSYGAKCPLLLTIILETFSWLQTLYIILETSFPSSKDHIYLIFHHFRDLASLLGLIGTLDTFSSYGFEIAVWNICSLYLLMYFSFMLFLFLKCLRNETLTKRASWASTLLNIAHSKVFFCSIYNFYLRFSVSGEFFRKVSDFPVIYGNLIKTLTVIFLCLTTILAGLKETTFYQIYNDGNGLAVKSNLHAMIQLTHKTILIPLIIDKSYNGTVNSILNLIFTIFYHVVIFVKLPYFNNTSMKLSVCFSGVQLTFSLILLWMHLFQSDNKVFELLLVLITPLVVKIMLGILNSLYLKILCLQVTSPAYVAHLGVLVKEYIMNQTEINFQHSFNYKNLYTYAIVTRTGFDMNDLSDQAKVKEFKLKIYQIVLDEVLKCYKKNPSSKLLLIQLFQIFCKKLKNISNAYLYIEKFQDLPQFINDNLAVMHMKNQIETMISKTSSQYEQSIECVEYFKYRELSEEIKKVILCEVKGHLDFWQLLTKEKVSVKKLMKTCYKIDQLAHKIEKNFVKNGQDFIKNFPFPLLMYRSYLNIIRGFSHLDHSFLNQFVHGDNSKLIKTSEKWFSKEKAIIVASIQKGSIGRIVDASHSVNDIFKIKKEELMGKRISLFMPSMIQEKHDELIQRYNEKQLYTLDLVKSVYCKAADSSFFLSQLSLTIYPNIKKGIALVATVNKREEYIPMFFVDLEGVIVDCSKELIEDFNLNFTIMNKIKLQDIIPDFNRVNQAFNSTYLPEITAFSTQQILPQKSLISQKPLSNELYQRNLRVSTGALYKESFTLTKDEDVPESTQRQLLEAQTERVSDSSQLYHFEKPKDSSRLYEDSQTVGKTEIEEDERETKPLNFQEIDDICKQFQNGGILRFPRKRYNEEYVHDIYLVKVDKFFFEGEFYKVVKLIKKLPTDESLPQTPKWRDHTSQRNSLNGNIWLQSPKKINKEELGGFNELGVNSPVIDDHLDKTGNHVEEKGFSLDLTSMEVNPVKQKRKRTLKNNSSSKETDSTFNERSTRIEKVFHHIFIREKSSKVTKVFFIIFYLGLFLSLASMIINFDDMKKKLKAVEIGAQLVDVNSERILSLVNAWGGAVYFYASYVISLTPIPGGDSRTLISSSNKALNQLNTKLLGLLEKVEEKEIVTQFFLTDTLLWEKDGDGNFNSRSFNEFTALKLQFSKLMVFENIPDKTMAQPKHEDLIYGLNNTMNALMISMESDFPAIQEVKNDIYNNTAATLEWFIGLQLVFLAISFFSIVVYAMGITKAYLRLLKVISIISLKNVQFREKELMRFSQYLQENVESIKFIENFETFTRNKKDIRKNTLKTDFKHTITFSLKTIKIRISFLLLVAISFLCIIIGFVSFNSLQTLHTLKLLKAIDEGISTVQIMGYSTFLTSSNLFYWMSFYNQTDMKVRNQFAGDQVDYNMKVIHKANTLLLAAFPEKDLNFYDADIDDFLSREVCGYLDLSIKTAQQCGIVTDNNTLGLLGLNSALYQALIITVDNFKANPTQDNFLFLLHKFLDEKRGITSYISLAYRYLRKRLLKLYIDKLRDQEANIQILFGFGIASCIFVGLFLRVVVLSRLRRIDKIRFKILKVLPLPLLLENRSFLFYLRLEFSSQLREIKSSL